MELSSIPSAARDANSGAGATDMTHTNGRYNFTWNCTYDRHDWIQSVLQKQSPVFTMSPKSQLRWWLVLYPRGLIGKSSHASLFLHCDNSNASEVRVKFSFRLTHPIQRTVTSPEMKDYCVFKNGAQAAGHGYEKFVINLFNYSDHFDIYCEIEVCPNDDTKNQIPREPFKVAYGRLREDMAAVFTAGKHTDFVITSGGVSFPVHKAILAGRSSVFASMFEHNTKEQLENHVEIPDTTPGAIKEMLRFIYTDEVTEIQDVAEDLLAMAEKYALDRLKDMCEQSLCGILTVENAAEILTHADLYRADQLKKRTIDFIVCHAADVMKTSGFKSMVTSDPHLMAEFLGALVTKRN